MKWYLKLLNKLGIYTNKQYEIIDNSLNISKSNIRLKEMKIKELEKENDEKNIIINNISLDLKKQWKENKKLKLEVVEIKRTSEVSYSVESFKPITSLNELEFNHAKDKIIRLVVNDIRNLLEDDSNFQNFNNNELRLKLLIKVVDLDD